MQATTSLVLILILIHRRFKRQHRLCPALRAYFVAKPSPSLVLQLKISHQTSQRPPRQPSKGSICVDMNMAILHKSQRAGIYRKWSPRARLWLPPHRPGERCSHRNSKVSPKCKNRLQPTAQSCEPDAVWPSHVLTAVQSFAKHPNPSGGTSTNFTASTRATVHASSYVPAREGVLVPLKQTDHAKKWAPGKTKHEPRASERESE